MNLNPKEWWSRSREFLQEVRREMKNVSWPTMDEVMGTTIVTVVTTFIFGFFLGMVDLGLSRLVRLVL